MNTQAVLRIKYALLALVFGQFAAKAEDPAVHKTEKEEFRRAMQEADKMQVNSDNNSRQIDRLTKERSNWESEILHFKGTVAYAQAQVDHYNKLDDKAEVEKWSKELSDNTVRLQAAEAEMKKADNELQAFVQNLRGSFGDNSANTLITPGVTLDVMVLEDDSLSMPYLVRRGGYILMRNVGRIPVAGKDLEGAEKAIKEKLAVNQIQNANVTVEWQDDSHKRSGDVIYLVGQFTHVGPWEIPQYFAPTALTTILRSGGTTSSADLTRVRLIRMVGGQGLVEEVNAEAILQGVGITSDLPLNPGDIIVIPSVANDVYITGNVKNQGILKILPDDELTAYTAILRSGGFSRFANKKKVTVLRDRGNGEKQLIPVSIKAVEKAKGSDILLEPKDIVIVPEKFFSF